MRTLKKVLALTIALATLFSLTAFAAYKDESAIASDTMSAVNLVNSLKIMTGDQKGNFNPTATITRAEAAKMVYVVRTGGNTNADGWKGQNVFTDTKGHWAEGFINYCASVGIIAGVGNGKFNPEGKLTGVELAKMLLVASGYKADIQGYTGSAWQSKVLADAENAGLFVKYAPAYVGAAPRQYAAVMFSNCLLKTNMAVYLSGELVNGAIGNQVLVGAKYFGLATKTGVLSTTGKGFTFETGAVTAPATAAAPAVASFAAPADLIYQEVKVIYNGNSGDIYDLYVTGTSKVYNVKADDVSFTSGLALTLPGYDKTTYATGADMELYLTGSLTTMNEKVPGNPDNTVDEVRAYYAALGNNNDDLRFIDKDGNGKIDVVIHTVATYGKVTENKAADGKFTVKNGTDAAIAAFCTTTTTNYGKLAFNDSVVAGDIVKLTTNMAGVKTIAKVEPVKGVYTAKNAAGDTFTLGGTKYQYAKNAYIGATQAPATFGKEYNVYTDGVYMIWATTDAPSITVNYGTDFALVIDAQLATGTGSFANSAKVDVLLASGERKVMTYADIDEGFGGTYVDATEEGVANPATKNITDVKGTVVQYKIVDGEISFKNAITDPNSTDYTFTKTDVAQNVAFSKANQLFTLAANTYVKAADNTTVFVKYSSSKYAVVKASELNSISTAIPGGAKFVAYNKNITTNVNTMGVAFIDLGTDGLPGTTTSASYAIYTGGKTEVYDADATSKTGYVLNVKYFDGTTATLKVSDTTYAAVTTLGTFYTVKTDEKGVSALTLANALVPSEFVYDVAMSAFGSNFIVANNAYYALADGAKIIYKNVNPTAADYYLGELVANDGEELVAGQNVSFTLKDGKITTLVVSFVAPN